MGFGGIGGPRDIARVSYGNGNHKKIILDGNWVNRFEIMCPPNQHHRVDFPLVPRMRGCTSAVDARGDITPSPTVISRPPSNLPLAQAEKSYDQPTRQAGGCGCVR